MKTEYKKHLAKMEHLIHYIENKNPEETYAKNEKFYKLSCLGSMIFSKILISL